MVERWEMDEFDEFFAWDNSIILTHLKVVRQPRLS